MSVVYRAGCQQRRGATCEETRVAERPTPGMIKREDDIQSYIWDRLTLSMSRQCNIFSLRRLSRRRSCWEINFLPRFLTSWKKNLKIIAQTQNHGFSDLERQSWASLKKQARGVPRCIERYHVIILVFLEASRNPLNLDYPSLSVAE